MSFLVGEAAVSTGLHEDQNCPRGKEPHTLKFLEGPGMWVSNAPAAWLSSTPSTSFDRSLCKLDQECGFSGTLADVLYALVSGDGSSNVRVRGEIINEVLHHGIAAQLFYFALKETSSDVNAEPLEHAPSQEQTRARVHNDLKEKVVDSRGIEMHKTIRWLRHHPVSVLLPIGIIIAIVTILGVAITAAIASGSFRPRDISVYGTQYPQSIFFGIGLTITSILLLAGTFLRFIQINIADSTLLKPHQREIVDIKGRGWLRLNLWMARINAVGSIFLSLLSLVSLKMSPPVHSLFAILFFSVTIVYQLAHSVLYGRISRLREVLPSKAETRVSFNHDFHIFTLWWYRICNVGTLLGFLGWIFYPIIVCQRGVFCENRWPASISQFSAVLFVLLYYMPFGWELMGVTFGDMHEHWSSLGSQVVASPSVQNDVQRPDERRGLLAE
ncbi:hypothetical protein PROFUN_14831 [Planoprotostelium fungivorum]|uniref:CWH43-like N-terminal domain-containing protein n=1 Tax=Planoprotostelium fungivorum TaxID=1890364 RepID=A0A2P6MNK0_9EUKA|nr:hypothetical protein PROFUN_14831 [Planoprotostelium fungivorum]